MSTQIYMAEQDAPRVDSAWLENCDNGHYAVAFLMTESLATRCPACAAIKAMTQQKDLDDESQDLQFEDAETPRQAERDHDELEVRHYHGRPITITTLRQEPERDEERTGPLSQAGTLQALDESLGRHTAAPWEAYKDNELLLESVSDKNRTSVAYVYEQATPAETPANIALVRAAPEMLSALLKAESLLRSYGQPSLVLDAVVDAIKRACGQT